MSSTYLSRGRYLLFLADDVEHTVLQRLLILGEPVLLPGIVKDASIKVVSHHATFKEA